MSVRISVQQLQQQLPEILDRAVNDRQPCIVERDGEQYAVIVSIQEWRRRTSGQRLDALGAEYRLPAAQQRRTEELLTRRKAGDLPRAEAHELKELLRASEAIMQRRAEALKQL